MCYIMTQLMYLQNVYYTKYIFIYFLIPLYNKCAAVFSNGSIQQFRPFCQPQKRTCTFTVCGHNFNLLTIIRRVIKILGVCVIAK
jgi:hypothetical protein